MTFRARLAILIAVVVTVLLVVCGVSMVYLTQLTTMQSVDRELAMRANNAVRDGGRGPRDMPGPPPGQGNDDDGIPRLGNLGPRFNPPRLPLGGLAPRMFPPTTAEVQSINEPFDATALSTVQPGGQIYSTLTFESTHIRVLTIGMIDGGRCQVAYNLMDVERLATTQTRLLLLLIPGAVLVTALIAWFLADKAVKPVERVTEAASAVTGEGLSADVIGTRLPVTGDDEIAALSRQFNLMLGRLEGSFQQREALLRQLQESLDAQRAFVADASHELRTPLARMKLLSSSALAQDSDAAGLKDALSKVDKGADDMAVLVQQLLTLARHDVASHDTSHRADLREVVDRAMALAEAVPGPEIEYSTPPSRMLVGKPDDLARALANVIENAKRYAPESPVIKVLFSEDGGQQAITVTDQGPGVAPEHIPLLTKRFYRADASRTRSSGGTGLGLAIVKAIAESSGGSVDIKSTLGQGTAVTLQIPLADQGPTK
ncbi:MAG: HAMP domain-containing sensor histidine kinase [bacterium]